jgi:hypothetical protein
MRPLLGIMVIGGALACSVGPRPEKVQPARDPAGATIELRLRTGHQRHFVTGELLAVQDSALLVRDTTRILLVPDRAVRNGTLLVRAVGVTFSGKPVDGTRKRLRLLSRYPGGISADLLSRLLAAYGRDSVETVH